MMEELLWLIEDLKLSDDAIVTEENDLYDENGTCYTITLRDCLGLDEDENEIEREYEEPELISDFLTTAHRATCIRSYNDYGGENLYYEGFYITLRFSSEIY